MTRGKPGQLKDGQKTICNLTFTDANILTHFFSLDSMNRSPWYEVLYTCTYNLCTI